MLTNAQIKQLKSLREKKFRDEYGQFLAEGEKMVNEALASGFNVLQIIREEPDVMSRITSLSTPPPVIAVVEKPAPRPLALERGLYLGLDAIRDPGNMGTILRLADWFGISTVFASSDSVEFYNPKVVQSSMGSIFRVNAVYCDLPELCRRFRQMEMPVYGTFLDGADIYTQQLANEGLIVMGSESFGIGAEVAAQVSTRLHIPSFSKGPGAESLNVATATAVILSEFRRR